MIYFNFFISRPLVSDLLICILQNSPVETCLETLNGFLYGEDIKKVDKSNKKSEMTCLEVENGANGGLYFKKTTVFIGNDSFLGTQYVSTEERIDGIVSILSPLKETKILGKLFMIMLKKIAEISKENSTCSQGEKSLLIVILL